MSSRLSRFRLAVLCTSFRWVPAPLWFLFVSPLLSWAVGGVPVRRWFRWPRGSSLNPLRRSFWWGGPSL